MVKKHKTERPFECKTVILFLNIRYPFDWKNPLGYFMAVVFQFIAATYFFLLLWCVVFLGIGFTFVVVAIINKDVKDYLKFINENAAQKRSQALKCLSDFIQDHSTSKGLSVLNISNITHSQDGRKVLVPTSTSCILR